MTAKELCELLMNDKPSEAIKSREAEVFELIPTLKECKGFDQKNEWHIYDVYEHILHVLDGVSKNKELRIAALFHDVGKPRCYKEDEQGVGHFYGHWDESQEDFEDFADKYDIENRKLISNLIFYHDKRFANMPDAEIDRIRKIFDKDGIKLLFELKRSDLKAQNPKYHYSEENPNNLSELDKQEKNILARFIDEDLER